MNNTIKKPLRKSIIVGCLLFVMVLGLGLAVINYTGYRETLYSHYEDYLTNIINYTAANIDVDDLEQCIKTNKESKKYKELQKLLDNLKDNMDMDFIYVIIPLNTNERDNVINVIAGVDQEEYKTADYPLVYLNMPAGDDYSPSVAKQYLDAFNAGKLTFFENFTEFGDEYTALLPLVDSKGEKVAALCVDMGAQELHTELSRQIFVMMAATVLIGAFFTYIFLFWTKKNITEPVKKLDEAVTDYANISHLQLSPSELVLTVPPINTENEVAHLSDSAVKMSDAIQQYARNLEEAREESNKKSVELSVALKSAQEANQAKTVFLSNMSHEIRTPMNAIIGLDSIALENPDLSDQTRTQLEKIGTSAKHLLRIINDILDMSRIESGRMVINNEDFSFAKALEQVNTIIAEQCREKGLNYHCRIIGEVDEYYVGDDMKLRQILINILGNAVKFTPEGGTINFDVERIARFDDKATIRFVIKDTGVGMSEEFLPKIFDSFSQEEIGTTNRYGSTGLGMSITKNLVDLMHGDIKVESEKGVGSTFRVSITFSESERVDEHHELVEVNVDEMCVLVIDDDPDACEHARMALAQAGMQCETATSGEEAVRMVELRAARREAYNLILVDWKMPGMDGLQATAKIRERIGDDSAIVLLTSYNWDDISQDAKKAGVDSFVAKPLFASTVLSEYRAVVTERTEIKPKKKAELKGRRILLAEDVPINAEIITMVLDGREMLTEVAENGKEAVEMVAAHPEGYYDAILMDMRMPVMNGLEASEAIRSMGRADSESIPIIALTANAFDEDVQRSLQAGLNAHLSKPVDPETLYETLESLIKD